VFEGVDITGVRARRILSLGLAHCPEGRRVFSDLAVAENPAMRAYLRSGRAGIAADLTCVYEQFPRLAERRRQMAGTLCGGEQQMLTLGRALMSRPKLIMFDQPPRSDCTPRPYVPCRAGDMRVFPATQCGLYQSLARSIAVSAC